MWTMIAVASVVFLFWLRRNPERAWQSVAIFLATISVFAAGHKGLVLLVAETAFPLNTMMAVIAFLLLSLSAYGFWPHLDAFSIKGPRDFVSALKHPNRGYSVVIILGDVIGATRMVHWDIIRPIERSMQGGRVAMERAEGAVFNFGISFWCAVLALLTLSQLYYLIPKHNRAGWTWLTAPFYPMPPRVIRFFLRR